MLANQACLELDPSQAIECAVRAVNKLYHTDVSCERVSCLHIANALPPRIRSDNLCRRSKNIAQPVWPLACSKILLKSTSVSSGPNRDSNFTISTFKLLLSSRYCCIFAMIVLSVALAVSIFFSITEALRLVVPQSSSLPP